MQTAPVSVLSATSQAAAGMQSTARPLQDTCSAWRVVGGGCDTCSSQPRAGSLALSTAIAARWASKWRGAAGGGGPGGGHGPAHQNQRGPHNEMFDTSRARSRGSSTAKGGPSVAAVLLPRPASDSALFSLANNPGTTCRPSASVEGLASERRVLATARAASRAADSLHCNNKQAF